MVFNCVEFIMLLLTFMVPASLAGTMMTAVASGIAVFLSGLSCVLLVGLIIVVVIIRLRYDTVADSQKELNQRTFAVWYL